MENWLCTYRSTSDIHRMGKMNIIKQEQDGVKIIVFSWLPFFSSSKKKKKTEKLWLTDKPHIQILEVTFKIITFQHL